MDKDFPLKTFLFQETAGMALFLNRVTEGAETSAKISFSTPQKNPNQEMEHPGKNRRKYNIPWREWSRKFPPPASPWSWLGFVHLWLLQREFGFLRGFPGCSPDFTDPWAACPGQGVFNPVFVWCLFTLPAGKSILPAPIHDKFALLTAVKIPLHGHREKQMSVV